MTIVTWPHKVDADMYGFGVALFKRRPDFFVVRNCTLILPDNFMRQKWSVKRFGAFPNQQLL